MGYRSEVRALVYGHPDVVVSTVMAWLHKGGTNFWALPGWVGALREYTQPDLVGDEHKRVIDLSASGWKWSDVYEDVAAWTRFMAKAEEAGLSCEFVRIGEDHDDVEYDCGGEDVQGWLWVSRQIECDITPPAEEPENVSQ